MHTYIENFNYEFKDNFNYYIMGNLLKRMENMLNNTNDTSLEDFLSKLYECIIHDKIDNSFTDFTYEKLNHKNKLYNAIESYEKNGTLFYSDFMAKHPEINIKSIRNIKMGEHHHRSLVKRAAYSTGTYYLKFTVFYEKKI